MMNEPQSQQTGFSSNSDKRRKYQSQFRDMSSQHIDSVKLSTKQTGIKSGGANINFEKHEPIIMSLENPRYIGCGLTSMSDPQHAVALTEGRQTNKSVLQINHKYANPSLNNAGSSFQQEIPLQEMGGSK